MSRRSTKQRRAAQRRRISETIILWKRDPVRFVIDGLMCNVAPHVLTSGIFGANGAAVIEEAARWHRAQLVCCAGGRHLAPDHILGANIGSERHHAAPCMACGKWLRWWTRDGAVVRIEGWGRA